VQCAFASYKMTRISEIVDLVTVSDFSAPYSMYMLEIKCNFCLLLIHNELHLLNMFICYMSLLLDYYDALAIS